MFAFQRLQANGSWYSLATFETKKAAKDHMFMQTYASGLGFKYIAKNYRIAAI